MPARDRQESCAPAVADDPGRHAVALTEEEQLEIQDRVREIWIFVRAAKEAAGDSGLRRPEAIRALAEQAR